MVKAEDKYSCLTDEERKIADLQRESVESISMLIDACDSLMGEVTGKTVANWGLVNDALVKGRRYIAKIQEQ